MSRPFLAGVVLAVLGGGITVFEATRDVHRALLAWLAAFGWGVTMAIAALVLVMTLHVTGARWWIALRPVFRALVSTLPAFAVVFVPIALGLHHVYPWAGASEPAALTEQAARALEHQRAWNSPGFFLARAAFYFVAWTVLVALLARGERIESRAPTSELPERFEAERRVSGAGLPIVAFTACFAAFDWLMSVEPGWVSSAFGLYVFCSGLVTATSLVAIGAWLARSGSPAHVHAVGRLMLTAIILWAYIGFFQLLLVWIADVPRESSFFGARARGSFASVDVFLVVGHFVVPFLLLLSRPLKRSAPALALVGAVLAIGSAVDFAWLVMPQADGSLRLVDAAPFVAVLGMVTAIATRRRRAEPVAVDPVLRQSLSYRSP